jgi:polysaccharide biosynthesis/export protein
MRRFGLMLGGVLLAVPVAGSAQSPQAAPATAPGTQAVSPAPVAAAPAPVETQAAPSGVAVGGQTQKSTGGPVDPERYVIGAEDSLQVTVWKEPTLSGTIPVRPDGMISLVLVGDMPAAGSTPMTLSADIAKRLKKYIQDPVVSVVVLGVNSQRIFLVGEIAHVGPVMLTPGMTPLQAIAAAGGPTPYASQKKIYILRGTPGKQQKIPFNYKAAMKGDSKQLDLTLIPGDTIVIP